MIYFVYIIKNQQSVKYIGQTSNIKQRLLLHNTNEVFSTKNRGPWSLIFLEEFNLRIEAMARERYLKSLKGGSTFKIIIKEN